MKPTKSFTAFFFPLLVGAGILFDSMACLPKDPPVPMADPSAMVEDPSRVCCNNPNLDFGWDEYTRTCMLGRGTGLAAEFAKCCESYNETGVL